MLRRTILLLSTLSLAASACTTTKRTAEALRPDKTHPHWFDCEPAGTRPQVNPEYRIDWAKVSNVERAKREFDHFVLVLRGRERTVADYVLDLEAKHFNCWNDTQAQLEFYRGLETPSNP